MYGQGIQSCVSLQICKMCHKTFMKKSTVILKGGGWKKRGLFSTQPSFCRSSSLCCFRHHCLWYSPVCLRCSTYGTSVVIYGGLLAQGWLIVASFLSQPEPVSPLMLPPLQQEAQLSPSPPRIATHYPPRMAHVQAKPPSMHGNPPKKFLPTSPAFPPTTTFEVGSPFSWHGWKSKRPSSHHHRRQTMHYPPLTHRRSYRLCMAIQKSFYSCEKRKKISIDGRQPASFPSSLL